MSEETLKCHYVHLLTVKISLNSELQTLICKNLNHFRKTILQESRALKVLKIIIQNNLSEIYPDVYSL